MGQSTYMAYQDPRIRLFAQFGLRDIDPRESGAVPGSKRYWSNWQGGLFTADGQPKPAAQAFKAEVKAPADHRDQAAVVVFGQVRAPPACRWSTWSARTRARAPGSPSR
jgi:hypothetical protein